MMQFTVIFLEVDFIVQ